MVRGQEGKNFITEKILSGFPGAFINEKEIRIPVKESNGEVVQIKVALTAAKTNVTPPSNSMVDAGAGQTDGIASVTGSDTPSEDVLFHLSRLIKELS